MKYEIKNRYTNKVQFTADIDCEEDEKESVKIGLSVIWAIKNKADLREADLQEADLLKANLREADLRWADLREADLREAELIILQLPYFTVYVQKTHTRIGCKYFKNSVWLDFTDEEINAFDVNFLSFWTKYKPLIEAAINSLNVE